MNQKLPLFATSFIRVGITRCFSTIITSQAPRIFLSSNTSEKLKISWLTRLFYRGSFRDKMNHREAALILGIRESANSAQIMDRYQTLMLLNHPDRGGSPYISQKINEAKDILII